jgi:hypothetical protein
VILHFVERSWVNQVYMEPELDMDSEWSVMEILLSILLLGVTRSKVWMG